MGFVVPHLLYSVLLPSFFGEGRSRIGLWPVVRLHSLTVIRTFLQARPLLAQALEDEEFEGLVDPGLEKNYVGNEMFRMIEAAAACVRHSAARRPRMSLVIMLYK